MGGVLNSLLPEASLARGRSVFVSWPTQAIHTWEASPPALSCPTTTNALWRGKHEVLLLLLLSFLLLFVLQNVPSLPAASKSTSQGNSCICLWVHPSCRANPLWELLCCLTCWSVCGVCVCVCIGLTVKYVWEKQALRLWAIYGPLREQLYATPTEYQPQYLDQRELLFWGFCFKWFFYSMNWLTSHSCSILCLPVSLQKYRADILEDWTDPIFATKFERTRTSDSIIFRERGEINQQSWKLIMHSGETQHTASMKWTKIHSLFKLFIIMPS